MHKTLSSITSISNKQKTPTFYTKLSEADQAPDHKDEYIEKIKGYVNTVCGESRKVRNLLELRQRLLGTVGIYWLLHISGGAGSGGHT